MPRSRSRRRSERAGADASAPRWSRCSRSSPSTPARTRKWRRSSRRSSLPRAKADIPSIYDIEDARSEGKPLAEAAANLKLASRTIEAIDRSGRDPSGAPVTGLPDAQRLLTTAFTTEGIERDPLQVEALPGSRSPASPRRGAPARRGERTGRGALARAGNRHPPETKAAAILDKLKAGSSLADVAAADGLKVETLTGIKRGEPCPALGRDRRRRLPHRQGRILRPRRRAGRAVVFASPTSWCRSRRRPRTPSAHGDAQPLASRRCLVRISRRLETETG